MWIPFQGVEQSTEASGVERVLAGSGSQVK
jgi:hypothetical protein